MFAELKDPVRRKIERYGLTRTIDPRHFFPTIESAVAAFRQQTGAQWVDADQAAARTAPDQAVTGENSAGIVPPSDITAPPAAG